MDAQDVYGRAKALGEVVHEDHVLTLRTSIIGRELFSHYGLLEWFLSQPGPVKGFTKAIFSGFTTAVVADMLRDAILPRPGLHGLYHVSAAPINKYDLLRMVDDAFDRRTEIVPDESVAIDLQFSIRPGSARKPGLRRRPGRIWWRASPPTNCPIASGKHEQPTASGKQNAS